jgi:hypothetical protein
VDAGLVTREVLLRHTRLRPDWWLFGIVTLCCLGIAGGFDAHKDMTCGRRSWMFAADHDRTPRRWR